ncbi:right-handed parallel beta-helix repeat-containing protein [Puniceicoccus vermicola]|uniref:Right-handed parallel beta-helix repeat-containing protein n=2 Tax=Puniceicoccus vermicola TaxID=388746 RepID=A0A7X1B2F0_9BACT|nr:right-handed parallel beta-helix repeat-containing protein [Puniceicoccus vermicola]MBC2604381.1 right-handed parallel beta-helix repeat-containing protein [Puniceicoccus vermicola]
MRQGPEVRGCRFEKMDDDGGNIGSTNLRVLSHPSHNTILMDLKNNHLVEVGDRFQITDGATGVVTQTTRVSSARIVKWRDRYALEVTMDDPLEISHTVDSLSASSDYGPPVKSKGAVTESSVPDLALDLDTICEGLVIEDCHIIDSRVRGFRLYTKGAKILNNHFENLAKPGITLGQSLSWFEGPSAVDILIEGNTFSRVRSTNIYIGDFSVAIGPLSVVDNHNIRITGNRFQDYGGPFADGPKYLEALLSTAIIVRNASDVLIENNEFFPSDMAPSLDPVIVDSSSTSSITLNGNLFEGDTWDL